MTVFLSVQGIFASSEMAMIGQLALAALLGGLIGLEREMHGQAAGLRTHMVLAIGACLVMIVSIYLWETQNADVAPGVARTGDPGRIAAHVVAGIGFLGAGAILRFGTTVKGLTTATCLWTAAGIGLAVGSGYTLAGISATALTLVAIFIFSKLEKHFLAGKEHRRVTVHGDDVEGLIAKIEAVLQRTGVKIKSVSYQRMLSEQKVRISIFAAWPESLNLESLTGQVAALGGIDRIDID